MRLQDWENWYYFGLAIVAMVLCVFVIVMAPANAAYLPLPGGTIWQVWDSSAPGAVGFSNDAEGISQAVYWPQPDTPISLTPNSDRFHGWVATGINEFGQIVGNGSNCAPSQVFCDAEPLPWGVFSPAAGYSAFIWFSPSSLPVRLYGGDCGGDNFVLGISGRVDPSDVPLLSCAPPHIASVARERQSVPEPSTLYLLAVLVAGIALTRIRTKGR